MPNHCPQERHGKGGPDVAGPPGVAFAPEPVSLDRRHHDLPHAKTRRRKGAASQPVCHGGLVQPCYPKRAEGTAPTGRGRGTSLELFFATLRLCVRPASSLCFFSLLLLSASSPCVSSVFICPSTMLGVFNVHLWFPLLVSSAPSRIRVHSRLHLQFLRLQSFSALFSKHRLLSLPSRSTAAPSQAFDLTPYAQALPFRPLARQAADLSAT